MWTQVRQIGLDVHRKFSTLVALDASGKVVCRQRLEHRDPALLQQRLRQFPPHTPVILEASFGWAWASDQVQHAGLDPHLSNSRKVAAWREARGNPKSNRRDALLLAELWNEQRPRWWEVWRAPQEVRIRREWMRHRMGLSQMLTTLKNRIHAVLHRHMVLHDYSDLFGGHGRWWLSGLIADAAAPLPDSARATLSDDLVLVEEVRSCLANLLRPLRQELKLAGPMRRLLSLPGIGLVLGFVLAAEIGHVQRFRDARHLASYSLLAPIADDSGEDDGTHPLGRHVGYIGRQTLKWAWIEAAHSAVKGKNEFRQLYDRLSQGGKKDRNKAIIAVAHLLCVRAHVMLRKDVDYALSRPERPGSTPHDKPLRKCTQPDHPMAPARARPAKQAVL